MAPAVRAGPRSRADVRVRRDALHPGEITDVDGIRITSRLRTAFDLARLLPRGVVAVDALARGEFHPDLLLNFTVRYPGLARRATCDRRPEPGRRPVGFAPGDPARAWSSSGVDCHAPVARHPVVDDGKRVLWLDLAHPEQRIGVEYDGGNHFATRKRPAPTRGATPGSSQPAGGCLRYTSDEMRHAPDRIVAEVRRALDYVTNRVSRRDAVQGQSWISAVR